MVKLYEGQNFDDLTKEKDLVVVQFFANWCNPCKMLSPVVDALAADNPEISFNKIDVDNYGELAKGLGVRGIPTLVLFKEGNEISRQSGFQPKQAIQTWINSFK